MIVAVIAVMTVQVSFVKIVDVIAVGNGRVVVWLAFVTVWLAWMMRAPAFRDAAVRIPPRDGDAMHLQAVSLLMLETAVTEVIHVIVMSNGRVATAGTVTMRNGGGRMLLRHGLTLLQAGRPPYRRHLPGGRALADRIWPVFCACVVQRAYRGMS